jgi:hypothetical protein
MGSNLRKAKDKSVAFNAAPVLLVTVPRKIEALRALPPCDGSNTVNETKASFSSPLLTDVEASRAGMSRSISGVRTPLVGTKSAPACLVRLAVAVGELGLWGTGTATGERRRLRAVYSRATLII